ncbi:MAG: hypothetical protein D6706_12075, partial [Chloroflexi bacterium]
MAIPVEHPPKDEERRRWWLFLIAAILLNFVCIGLSVWLALITRPLNPIPASLIVESNVDYSRDENPVIFAPIDPGIIEEIATDEAELQATPTAIVTPNGIVPFPPTATPTHTPTHTPTNTNTPPPTNTPQPTNTNTPTRRPTNTPTFTPTPITPTPTPPPPA